MVDAKHQTSGNKRKEKRSAAVVWPLGCAGRFMALVLSVGIFLIAGLLGAVGCLLLISGRDFTVGPDNIPFWPSWVAPRDLLHDYVWWYVIGGVLLPLLLLPVVLALLDKMLVALEKKNPTP